MEIMNFLEHRKTDSLNVNRLKAFYRAASEKDQEAISRLLVDEPVWNVCPGFPDGGVYSGMAEVYGSFYPHLLSRFYSFAALPEVFIDGGNVVNVLGFYQFVKHEGDPCIQVRFSHTWGIDNDGRIKGVWQVADSAQFITHQEG